MMPTSSERLGSPRVFVSSVYAESNPDRPGLPTFPLRRALWEMGQKTGIPIWVAEHCGVGRDVDWMTAVRACLDELSKSDLLLVLLTRRYGTPVLLSEKLGETASSVFEVELFYASQWRVPTVFYALRGYEPEPELARLIRILRLQTERNWFPVDESAVIPEVRALLAGIKSVPAEQWRVRFLPDRLSDERSFAGVSKEIHSTRLSFIDRFTPLGRDDFSAVRFEQLMTESVAATSKIDQLGFLWMAMRELSIGGWDPARADAWRTLSKKWPSTAAWLGLHGVLNTGVLAAFHTQSDLAAKAPLDGATLPYGPVASEFYSTGLICETSAWKARRFRAAVQLSTLHAAQSEDPSGAIAIRASAKLRLAQLGRPWLIPDALSDYRKVWRAREKIGASASAVGEALVEYGFAQFQVRSRIYVGKGAALKRMREGVCLLESDSSSARIGFLVRGKRKLAHALTQAGRVDEAASEQRAADELARAHGVLGQLNRDEQRESRGLPS